MIALFDLRGNLSSPYKIIETKSSLERFDKPHESKVACTWLRRLFPRGNSLIFFRTPPLKSQKNHIQNHKITRKITCRKHQKSQITDKLLKNHTKNSLEITRITKITERKSCDFKITKITYAVLRSDLPLDYFSADGMILRDLYLILQMV